MQKKNLWAIGTTLLVLSVSFTGCGKSSGMDDSYSFEERANEFHESFQAGKMADPFAKNLCVPVDESQFDNTGINSEAAVLFGVDQPQVIYSKHAMERLYPASTTKIMTAILAIEEGNMTDIVTVTEDSVITEAGATLCGIKPGDKISLEQLLYGLMMPSGNDAANAIAVHIAGSIENFSEMMNEKAWSIGATQTHFMNPSGLNDENHYTTAYDLYLMFRYAMDLPMFREVVSTSSYTADFINGTGEATSQTWKIGNWYMNGEKNPPEGVTVLGGKTGTTKAAGYCLVMASADENQEEYISVVLKAENRKNLYENMTNIISKIVN